MADMWTGIQWVYFGRLLVRATVTNDPAAVNRWLRKARSRLNDTNNPNPFKVVGLGVQWIPGGGAGAATLQLSAGYNCLVIQLHRSVDVPDSLRFFLTDPDLIFVGVGNYMDAAMLMESRHHLVVDRLVDLGDVAHDARGLDRYTSFGDLALAILGIDGMEEDEAVLQSAWDAEVLTLEQVRFACRDAYLAHKMGIQLWVWNWVH